MERHRVASGAHCHHEAAQRILPLPRGEGRGEGEECIRTTKRFRPNQRLMESNLALIRPSLRHNDWTLEFSCGQRIFRRRAEIPYEGWCDRLAISPDGKIIYLPSLEKEHWHAIEALSGKVLKKIITNSGAHNTIIGSNGKLAYLAGLKSPILRVTDTSTHEVIREIGPFGNVIRPFTINGS